ncbi:transposase [Paraburkholderia sp. RL17-383-BIF-A]|jgi:transposase|uniref:transposase n=1 Tax=Paraburkholderia TaxID=1822464 RepID=UPI0038B9BBBA
MPHIPLSDEDWAKIEHLFPHVAKTGVGRPRRDPRGILNAIFWVTQTGAKWHHLPAHYPPAQSCYIKWLEWRRAGLMSKVMETLNETVS